MPIWTYPLFIFPFAMTAVAFAREAFMSGGKRTATWAFILPAACLATLFLHRCLNPIVEGWMPWDRGVFLIAPFLVFDVACAATAFGGCRGGEFLRTLPALFALLLICIFAAFAPELTGRVGPAGSWPSSHPALRGGGNEQWQAAKIDDLPSVGPGHPGSCRVTVNGTEIDLKADCASIRMKDIR